MKALAYEPAHALKDFAIHLMDVSEPALRDADLLIEVRAIGINPGEAFIRQMKSAEPRGRVILGWEFAGVVVQTGSDVTKFKIGDRVFGTGDMTRDGCWAERVAVDHRIVAKLPDSLPFDAAASLPVGAITAWEALFRDRDGLTESIGRVLIIGGAGGVGSLATQLLKAKTQAFVICTASRPESEAWCRAMGADLVIDHTKDLAEQLGAAGYKSVDMVLSTAGTSENIGRIAHILRPFGQVSITDGVPTLDASLLGSKSITLHTEMIFSRVLADYHPEQQALILEATAALAEAGSLRAITTRRLEGLTAESMRAAHASVETHRTVGKIVIAV